MNVQKLLARAVKNWPAKVLSIGLAIILFMFHRMSTLETRFFSVPLEVESNGSLMPSSSYPRIIRISLRGEAASIYPVLEDDIEVFVDIGTVSLPGTYTFPVQWQKKGTALGVETLQITVDPMEITLSLDLRISKTVPLVASFRGQVEAGYVMTSYSLNPAQVVIDGPEELMWDISEAFTETIDLDGHMADFSATVNILNRDPLMFIRGKGTTLFRGNIKQIFTARNITGVPITVTGLMDKLTGELETSTGIICLEGDNQNTVNRFVPPVGFLKIDCSEINAPGTYVLRVIPGIARNMSVRVEPEEVRIMIYLAGEGTPP